MHSSIRNEANIYLEMFSLVENIALVLVPKSFSNQLHTSCHQDDSLMRFIILGSEVIINDRVRDGQSNRTLSLLLCALLLISFVFF